MKGPELFAKLFECISTPGTLASPTLTLILQNVEMDEYFGLIPSYTIPKERLSADIDVISFLSYIPIWKEKCPRKFESLKTKKVMC